MGQRAPRSDAVPFLHLEEDSVVGYNRLRAAIKATSFNQEISFPMGPWICASHTANGHIQPASHLPSEGLSAAPASQGEVQYARFLHEYCACRRKWYNTLRAVMPCRFLRLEEDNVVTRSALAPLMWKLAGQDGVVPGTTRSALR